MLTECLVLWTRSLEELVLNLKETSPENGSMLSEIFYWRDITRVLSAVSLELKLPYVELVVQLTQNLNLVKDF